MMADLQSDNGQKMPDGVNCNNGQLFPIGREMLQ
jgi:hypothetical protein